MVIISNCIWVETDFEFQFFLGLQSPFNDINLENPILFDLFILKMPVDILLINIADGDCDKFRVASVRFSHYLPLEVNDGGLEKELRLNALAFYGRNIIEFD